MKVETFDQLQERIPERIVEHAVRGMLPKGRVSHEKKMRNPVVGCRLTKFLSIWKFEYWSRCRARCEGYVERKGE